jgi:hypothetical protein
MVMVKVRSYGEGKEILGFGIPKFVPYKGEFPKVEAPATPTAKPKKETKKWIKPKP